MGEAKWVIPMDEPWDWLGIDTDGLVICGSCGKGIGILGPADIERDGFCDRTKAVFWRHRARDLEAKVELLERMLHA